MSLLCSLEDWLNSEDNAIFAHVLRTVLLKGNVALARNFLSSRRNHSIEQRVGRVASQANTRLDTLELASFNSARCEDSKELDTPHC